MNETFQIAIAGLGLMGASLAGALRGFRNARIAGTDRDDRVCREALETGLVDEASTDPREALRGASLVLLCVYARHIPKILRTAAPILRDGAIVTDICGVKTPLYAQILDLLPPGTDYVGIHPMAGKERTGFANRDPRMFAGCGFVITALPNTRPCSVELMRELAAHIGAGHVAVTVPEEHDEQIAYTSGLTHIAAAALCLGAPEGLLPAFTGGAWRDATRVADVNAEAWTDLLMENREATLAQTERYLSSLEAFRSALQDGDREALHGLLQKAGACKRHHITLSQSNQHISDWAVQSDA